MEAGEGGNVGGERLTLMCDSGATVTLCTQQSRSKSLYP